jgi:MFS family permease
MVTSPLSGAVIDRFGPKRVILTGTLLVALTAGLRGLASGFTSLLAIIFVVGSLVPLVTNSSYKICGIWFPRQQLGLANGVLSMGMALGLLLGSLLSATVLSPWLGGWRNVMFFYAGLAALFCIPWVFTRPAPEAAGDESQGSAAVFMRQALAHIVKLKNVWLLGLALMGISGCLQGMSGYLPLYLRGLGWSDVSADSALSLLSAMSMIFILPIALWSDRLAARKKIVVVMVLMIALGTGLLAVANGWPVWAAIVLAGAVRDGSTALLITMVIETEGVGPVYAGTATGFVMLFFFIGNLLSPPIGNKLADVLPGLPFAFWAALAALAAVSLSLVRAPRSTSLPPL